MNTHLRSLGTPATRRLTFGELFPRKIHKRRVAMYQSSGNGILCAHEPRSSARGHGAYRAYPCSIVVGAFEASTPHRTHRWIGVPKYIQSCAPGNDRGRRCFSASDCHVCTGAPVGVISSLTPPSPGAARAYRRAPADTPAPPAPIRRTPPETMAGSRGAHRHRGRSSSPLSGCPASNRSLGGG